MKIFRAIRVTLLSLMVIAILGCAGAKLKTEMAELRGYSTSEIDEIMSQMDTYKRRLFAARQATNAFDSGRERTEESNLKGLWCNCWKKLQKKCRQRPEGLTGDDRELWLKANAVEMAFASLETSLDTKPNTRLDGDECL